MAEAQTQNEEQDNDDVADKAADIGKDLGVQKGLDGKENIPDYEVIEDDGEDDRIAKERVKAPGAAKGERKQLSNKEKRELRKKRLAEKFNEKDEGLRQRDETIAQQSQKLQELEAWRNQVEGRLTNVDKQAIEDAINQTTARIAQTKKLYADAFAEGDGVKAGDAMTAMYDAARRLEQLQGVKQQFANIQPQSRTVAEKKPDALLVSKAKAWAKNNDWYRPEGGDEDSEIARAVSQVLADEGFDPKSDDYWDELDDRLAKRGIGEYDEEAHELDDEPAPRQRKRAAPPVGGGSSRGDVAGKKQIKLPTAFINTLKENGIWADVEKRNRIINGYLKNQKANG